MRRTLVISTFAALTVAALTVAAVAAGSAQDPAERRGPRGPRPFIAALDTNRDATISSEELTAAPASLLTLDANSDGQLSLDELRPGGAGVRRGRPAFGNPPGRALQGRGGRGPGAHPLLAAFDANGDRTLSAEEIAAAPTVLKALDRNADGQLTREELGPAAGRRGAPRRGR